MPETARGDRRCFAQLAGAGLDAKAIELVHWPLKKKLGPLAYVIAGLNALLHPPSKIIVTDGGRAVTGELVLIGNGRLYGGEFRIFPEADLRDGLLDVCVFPRVNWLTLARCCAPLMLRRRLPLRETENFQSATFTLSGSPPGSDSRWTANSSGASPPRFRSSARGCGSSCRSSLSINPVAFRGRRVRRRESLNSGAQDPPPLPRRLRFSQLMHGTRRGWIPRLSDVCWPCHLNP